MKKILMLAVAAAAFSTASFAASVTIGCTIATGDASGNPATVTPSAAALQSVCPSFSIAAGSITNVDFFVLTGFTGNGFANDTLTITGTYSPTSGTFTLNPVVCATTGTGNVSSTTCGAGNTTITSRTDGLGGSTIGGTSFNLTYGVSGDAGLPFAGSTSGQAVVTFTYNVPQSGVPEPSTVALIGAGLVGVASIARRRR